MTNDVIIDEAQRCRDLLAHAAELGERPETARLLGEITFTAEDDHTVLGAIEESQEGLALLRRVKEIFAAARLNLGIYERSEVAEYGPYAYRMTWTTEGR